MYIHAHTHTYIDTYITHIHRYIHNTHIHRYIHNTHIHRYIDTYIHIYIHTYIHTYIYTNTDKHRQKQTNTDKQTHTHTYIYIYIFVMLTKVSRQVKDAVAIWQQHYKNFQSTQFNQQYQIKFYIQTNDAICLCHPNVFEQRPPCR